MYMSKLKDCACYRDIEERLYDYYLQAKERLIPQSSHRGLSKIQAKILGRCTISERVVESAILDYYSVYTQI